MPFIQTRTNCKVDKLKQEAIKARLGEAVINIKKNESWLMLEFVPECDMYFAGKDDQVMAYVDIKLYGACNPSDYDNMTVEVTKILNEELGIAPNLIYVSYAEFNNWGYGGHNF